MSPSSFAAVLRHPTGRGLIAAWRALLLVTLAVWSLAVLAWLTLHWGILPRLNDWRPQIEAWASRSIGHPLQIGRIDVRSSGWVPAFTLRDVVLRDARGAEALRLPQVDAALDVPTLLTARLRFAQLLVDGARLAVRRDTEGRWHVAGLDVDSGAAASADAGALADWFFAQHEFVIRGGTVRWTDEQRAAPPLQLDNVTLAVRNRFGRHAFKLQATPVAADGARFTLVAQLRAPLWARAGDWRRWAGTLYADLPDTDLALLRRHVDLPLDLRQGRAALRAWLDIDQAQATALTLDAAVRDVALQLDPGLPPLALARLSALASAERRSDGGRLRIDRLAFDTADGQTWAPSQLTLGWQQTPLPRATAASAASATAATAAGTLASTPRPLLGGELSADRLDLPLLARLAESLPLPAALRSALAELQPQGQLQQLQLRWQGPADAPRHFDASAQLRGLALAPGAAPAPDQPGRPGLRGADVQLSLSDTGGQAELSLRDGQLLLPGVFEPAAVPLQQASAKLQWRLLPGAAGGTASGPNAAPTNSTAPPAPPRIELTVQQLRLANDDARITASGSWHTGQGAQRWPGVLALQGTLRDGRATAVARYLPLALDAGTRHWVQRAVQAGSVPQLDFLVRGDLARFPFPEPQDGAFRLQAQLQGVTLNAVPDPADGHWPAYTDLAGELVIERQALQLRQLHGRVDGLNLALDGVKGDIRHLGHAALLEISGTARGPASELLRHVQLSPVGGWLDHALARTTASGAAELDLALNIPLDHPIDTVVRGSVQLAGNDLQLRPDLPLLGQARGRIDFTHRGFSLAGLRAQVAGGEAQFDGGSQADGSLRLGAAGQASADGLRALALAQGQPVAAHWAERLHGQAPYRLQLAIAGGHTDLVLTSPLTGLALDLPAPLGKAAEPATALRLSRSVLTEGRGQPSALWRLELGALQAVLQQGLGDGPARAPARSALAYGAPLPEPVAGGRAVLRLDNLDLDRWQALAEPALLGGRSTATPAAAPPAAAAPGASAPATRAPAVALAEASLLQPPRSLRLDVGELRMGGRRLSHLGLDVAQRSDGSWQLDGQADQGRGSIVVVPGRAGSTDAGRIQARLSRLSLPKSDTERVTGLLDQAPASVPALDIEVEQFELQGHNLGQLTVRAVNHAGRDWQLDQLTLANPDATLSASGRWALPPGGGARRMALDFNLAMADGGKLLERLGLGQVLRGGQGSIQGQLGWRGSPLAFDIPSLDGRMAVALDNGQFLKADAGAARLLGILSLQSLPRRLLLDFRDVVDAGFAFDNLSGEVRVAQGVASTNTLRLRAVQAVVLMAGSADLQRETQDLQVVVVPEINAGTASLAYAAINPAIGLGTFLGQWLLRGPLQEANTREFQISGSWDQPQVSRVERKPGEAAAPSPAAASTPTGAPP